MVLDYTRITLIGALPKIMIYIPFWFLRLNGRNKTVTAMLAVMGGLNILLDVVFLIGMNMGIFGVALASVIATALACAEVFRVRQDTSSEYQHLCQAKGARMEQSKLIRVLTREDQIAFFNAARENG